MLREELSNDEFQLVRERAHSSPSLLGNSLTAGSLLPVARSHCLAKDSAEPLLDPAYRFVKVTNPGRVEPVFGNPDVDAMKTTYIEGFSGTLRGWLRR